MGSGGVYDQIAGGFHRYSVDERWCVPHFEKMSYDNSELLKNFLHGYQVTRDPFLAQKSPKASSIGRMLSSRTNRAAAFTPARTPTRRSTMTAIISPGRSTKFARCSRRRNRASSSLRYDVEAARRDAPQPAKNVLWIARSIAEVTRTIGGGDGNVHGALILARAKGKLLAAREARPAPFVDTTLYVAWNAMYVSAYLDAAAVLGGEKGAACRRSRSRRSTGCCGSLERRARIRASHRRRAPGRLARRSDFRGDRAARCL
jgi:uncharacterized protein YyaL (SSP411 family)